LFLPLKPVKGPLLTTCTLYIHPTCATHLRIAPVCMPRRILSMGDKKIVRWGTGWVVFVTTEAKKLGWTGDDDVTVAAVEDEEGEAIVVRRGARRRRSGR